MAHTHAMRSADAGSKVRVVAKTMSTCQSIGMASASVCGALTMAGHAALAMHCLCVLRMHRRVA